MPSRPVTGWPASEDPPRSADITTTTPPSDKSRPHRARRGDGDLLREQILDATEALLITTGDADRISVRMVADAVGRTSPSIYLHFDTKDELIHAVCQRQFDVLTETFTQACAGVDDPVERIAIMGKAYVDFALEHPEQYRVIFMSNGKQHDEPLDALKLVACFGMLHDDVQRAIDDGRFRAGDAGLISLSLWASMHGIAALWILHGDQPGWPDIDQQVDQALNQNLHGLLEP